MEVCDVLHGSILLQAAEETPALGSCLAGFK